ncbi:4532_t:CDS:2, partial [Ambispora leptoticha]
MGSTCCKDSAYEESEGPPTPPKDSSPTLHSSNYVSNHESINLTPRNRETCVIHSTSGFNTPQLALAERKKTQLVVGIDFGTTESGFAFCPRPLNNGQINIDNIETNAEWPGWWGKFKNNTALEYD